MNTKIVYAAGIVILIIGIVFYFVNTGVPTSEESIPSSSSSITTLNGTETDSAGSIMPVSSSSSITTLNGTETDSAGSIMPVSSTSSPSPSITTLNGTETDSAGSIMPVSSTSSPSSPNAVGSNYENLTVLAKSLDILPRNDILTAEIALDVHNPNRGAAILETLSYSIYLDNVRLVSADIGAKPEGFVDNLGSVYTIIGNQTITLRDRQPITEEGVSLFNSNGTLIQDTNNNTSTTQISSDSFVINGTFATSLNRGSQTQASEHVFNLQFPLKQ